MAAVVRRDAGQAWLATLLGIFVLVAGGFALGLIVGVVSQEPELVVGHMAGRSTEIAWSGDRAARAQQAVAVATDQPVSLPVTEASVPAVAAAPPRGARTPSAGPRSGFAVQVGAFATGSAADEVAEGLRGRGYPVYVVDSSDDGRLRVRVGPVSERSDAERLAQQLKVDEKLPTWVLRERGS